MGIAAIVLGLAALYAWAPTQATQLGTLVVSTAAVVTILKNYTDISGRYSELRARRVLEQRLARGQFDAATIAASTRYYIRPACTNIDPASEVEFRAAATAVRQSLFEVVDQFLSDTAPTPARHLMVLADSGIGKTSFVLNYYAYNERKWRKGKRHKLALVYLGSRDSDAVLGAIQDRDNRVLILDAFDEDVAAIADHRERLRELLEKATGFKRVVITCRSQFFHKDEEIPRHSGILLVAPRPAGTAAALEISKIYIAPFGDDDVKRYLKRRFPFWQRRKRAAAMRLALSIPLLSARPMLLAHIPEVVAAGRNIQRVFELYEIMINAWLRRESYWAVPSVLREFSERFAVETFTRRELRGSERMPLEELAPLAGRWNLPLEAFVVTGRSLLNRDAEGNYKFAHRSIMEYLFVVEFLRGNTEESEYVLTDQMALFLSDLVIGCRQWADGLTSLLRQFRTVRARRGYAALDYDSDVVFAGLSSLVRDRELSQLLRTQDPRVPIHHRSNSARESISKATAVAEALLKMDLLNIRARPRALEDAQQAARRILSFTSYLAPHNVELIARLDWDEGFLLLPVADELGSCVIQINPSFAQEITEVAAMVAAPGKGANGVWNRSQSSGRS